MTIAFFSKPYDFFSGDIAFCRTPICRTISRTSTLV